MKEILRKEAARLRAQAKRADRERQRRTNGRLRDDCVLVGHAFREAARLIEHYAGVEATALAPDGGT